MNFHHYLQRRENGVLPRFGERNEMMKRLYKSYKPYHSWNDWEEYGSIFNLEFSPGGNILAAACERKAIVLFDALTTQQTHEIFEAHEDNVNCIKFLDNRRFATCSDDKTVALWDLRFLKAKVRSLHGHSDWVKNVEYSQKDGLLVTSGFDGSVFTWDINTPTEEGLVHRKVFHTSGLMRCRISPDSTKMVICTTGGYLLIFHNLDLNTVYKDLYGFRPNIYRLMQMGDQYIPQAAKHDHLFSKKQQKNRVEFVTDFPPENNAEVVLALQIHPKGSSFLSRNISADGQTEWSCIHDLNEEKYDITITGKEHNKRKRKHDSSTESQDVCENAKEDHITTEVPYDRRPRAAERLSPSTSENPTTSYTDSLNIEEATPSDANPTLATNREPTYIPDIWAAETTLRDRQMRNSGLSGVAISSYNVVYAIASGILTAPEATNGSSSSDENTTNTTTTTAADLNSDQPSTSTATNRSQSSVSNTSTMGSSLPFIRQIAPFIPLTKKPPWLENRKKIFQNAKKLMFYMRESTAGKGFIKEPSFSSDGRIVCSPYEYGVRLLGYTESCLEYPNHANDEEQKPPPKPLKVIKGIKCHKDFVLCTKFSPRQPLIVTGCRSGKIVWHYPQW